MADDVKLFDVMSNGCWIWIGQCDNNGAPVQFKGSTITSPVTERYIRHCGALNPGEIVVQTCGDCRCVNPAHLKTGSFGEYQAMLKNKPNIEDMKLADDLDDAMDFMHGDDEEISNEVIYLFTDPDGKPQSIPESELADFCKANKMSAKRMMNVITGKNKHHKGWKKA